MGTRSGIGIAAASIDEGVEADNYSETDYEIDGQHNAPGCIATYKHSVPSFPSTDSSSLASFDSNIEVDAASSPAPSVASSDVASSVVTLPCFPVTPVIMLDHSAAEVTDSGNQSEVGLPRGTGALQLPSSDASGPTNVVSGSDVDNRDMSFHSGRRASDGLVNRADVFRLQESMKTRGVAELRKELEMLQLQTSAAETPGAHRKMQLLSVMGRAAQQRSFDESTSSMSASSSGRQNLPNICKGRPMIHCANTFRPRLAMFHRARLQAETCPLISRTRLHPEHHSLLQQRFQGLNISGGDSCLYGVGLTSSSQVVSTTSTFQRPLTGVQLTTIAGCLSDQRLATALPAGSLDASTCQSADSLHYTRAPQVSTSPSSSVRSPCLPTASGFMDATAGVVSSGLASGAVVIASGVSGGGGSLSINESSVRRYIFRRTLFQRVHQQTCGEEDDASGINASAALGVDSVGGALPAGTADDSNSRNMDVT